MNCRESCATECPPVPPGVGTRCADYRRHLVSRQNRRESNPEAEVPDRLRKLGVPDDTVRALRNPLSTKSLEAAKRFALAERYLARSLVLVGIRGVGKSVAAAHVLAEWAKGHDWNAQPSGGKQLTPAVWCNAREITSETDFGKVNPEWLEGLRRCHVLVVDELGKDATEPGLLALRDVLTHRHEKQRATVITSNLALADFVGRYGESWYERLKVSAIAPDLRHEKSLRAKGRP